jgi:hypothetical protein
MTLPDDGQEQQHYTGALIGTWKLQSFTDEDLETGLKTDPFGAHPSGYLSYGPDGRMHGILLKEGRKAPDTLVPTDAERVDLYSGLIAYAGTYSIEGDLVSHHIDASWNESWTGTTQVRQFRIDGKSLYIRTLPAKNPLTGNTTSAVLVWNKVG